MSTRLRLPLALLALLMSIGGGAYALISNPTPIRLSFDYPTNAMNTNGLWFNLHGIGGLGTPPGLWPVDQSIPSTRWYSNGVCTAPVVGTNYVLSFTNMTIPGPRFWYMAASNDVWGEASDFSNVLALPAPPVSTGVLKAYRAW